MFKSRLQEVLSSFLLAVGDERDDGHRQRPPALVPPPPKQPLVSVPHRQAVASPQAPKARPSHGSMGPTELGG